MRARLSVIIALAFAANIAAAQTLTTPPDGENQHASVSQSVGLVKISIDYHSPKVHHPRTKEDRRGKIYGKDNLVPYGFQSTLGYGNCTQCPWRAGANENTVFTVSHPVKIEGQPLPAGSYGLHMIPGESEWTVIFSKNAQSWGSFFYDPAEDQLRVNVKPSKSEYHEWLTYEFPVRNTGGTVAVMKWEDLQVPINITIDNINDLYLAQMKQDLRGSAGFDWNNWVTAGRFALQNKIGVKDALSWAQTASQSAFPGQENFQTLSLLADAQIANGLDADAQKTRERALNHPTATAIDLHQYARTLLQQGKKEEALTVWQLNAKKHPNAWPVNVGLARGYSAVGKYSDALKYAKLAVVQAPDDANKKSLQSGIVKLEAGKDMNQ